MQRKGKANKTLKTTTNSREYKITHWSKALHLCCPPHKGCNSHDRKDTHSWKTYRKTQYYRWVFLILGTLVQTSTMKIVILSFIVTVFLICCGIIIAFCLDHKDFIEMCNNFYRMDLTSKMAFCSGMTIGFGVLFFIVYNFETYNRAK